ncbi:MAG TPA: non-homologous end-joining DNA ligase [Gemmatimonadaceae bacterium]|nr:non-homologous end-joining DNA ligase [Gemmatimonadaceae bacterium]
MDLEALPRSDMAFVEPMLPKAVSQLPEGSSWQYEIKWDGYRALAIKKGDRVALISRRNHSFAGRFPSIADGLSAVEDGTILDGEVVAFDDQDMPSFGLLQHRAGDARRLAYFVFDVLVFRGRDVRRLALARRRELLDGVMQNVRHPVRRAPILDFAPRALVAAVRAHGLEGVVAKRIESHYESKARSGAWVKFKVNRRQELVIGGYRIDNGSFADVAVGYYDNRDRLVFVGRIQNGFTPDVRHQVLLRLRQLEVAACPFDNLPQSAKGGWGEGLTAEAMCRYQWVRPEVVAEIEFREWTSDDHLRHSRFVALRDDKEARDIRRE